MKSPSMINGESMLSLGRRSNLILSLKASAPHAGDLYSETTCTSEGFVSDISENSKSGSENFAMLDTSHLSL